MIRSRSEEKRFCARMPKVDKRQKRDGEKKDNKKRKSCERHSLVDKSGFRREVCLDPGL